MNFSMDLNTNIDITMKGKGSDHLANALSLFQLHYKDSVKVSWYLIEVTPKHMSFYKNVFADK